MLCMQELQKKEYGNEVITKHDIIVGVSHLLVNKTCFVCDKVFQIIPARTADGRGKYCLITCKHRDSKCIIISCIVCGKPQKTV